MGEISVLNIRTPVVKKNTATLPGKMKTKPTPNARGDNDRDLPVLGPRRRRLERLFGDRGFPEEAVKVAARAVREGVPPVGIEVKEHARTMAEDKTGTFKANINTPKKSDGP